MKFFVFAFAAVLAFANTAYAAPVIGEAAPAFTAQGADGKTYSLSDFAGKTVVLEWTNNECPFVQKHYDSGNMQSLQKKAAEEGIVWLSVISSAPGEQGHVDAAAATKLTTERGAVPTAVLLDESGEVGRAYEAKTTPHMFVIDGKGKLVYAGAIDSIKSASKDDIAKAENYVASALEALKAGRAVATSSTTAYGCGVKYN